MSSYQTDYLNNYNDILLYAFSRLLAELFRLLAYALLESIRSADLSSSCLKFFSFDFAECRSLDTLFVFLILCKVSYFIINVIFSIISFLIVFVDFLANTFGDVFRSLGFVGAFGDREV